MSFILYVIVGFAAGLLGGMGMGGGTVLIPALTILLGVGQHVAQATNVISFIPMAAFVLPAHKKKGLLKTDGLWLIIIPALVSTALFGLLMAALPAEMLQKLFGAFLLVLAVKQALSLKNDKKSDEKRGFL